MLPTPGQFLTNKQFESRPAIVGRADPHVDKAERECDGADRAVGDSGAKLGGFLGQEIHSPSQPQKVAMLTILQN